MGEISPWLYVWNKHCFLLVLHWAYFIPFSRYRTNNICKIFLPCRYNTCADRVPVGFSNSGRPQKY